MAWGADEGNVAVMGVSAVPTGRVLCRANGANEVTLTPDGRRVGDAQTGKVVHKMTGPGRVVNSVVVSRDGSTVAASTQRADPKNYEPSEARVAVWDVASGRLRKVVAARPGAFWGSPALALSADGKTVAYTENKRLTLTTVEKGAELWRVENPGNSHYWGFVAFAPDAGSLPGIRTPSEAMSYTTRNLFDAITGRAIRTRDGESQ